MGVFFKEPPLALPLVRIEPIDDGVSTGSLQTAAPLMDRGVQNSTFFTIDNFEDLDVPGGIEGEFLKAQFLKIKKNLLYDDS